MLRNNQFIVIVTFVTSPALALPDPAPTKPSHISKIVSTHPVEETIYKERERESVREGWALLSLQCWCVFCWIS